MEVINVPKPMGHNKRMVLKASSMERPVSKATTTETAMAQASSMKSTVLGGIRIGDSPDEE